MLLSGWLTAWLVCLMATDSSCGEVAAHVPHSISDPSSVMDGVVRVQVHKVEALVSYADEDAENSSIAANS